MPVSDSVPLREAAPDTERRSLWAASVPLASISNRPLLPEERRPVSVRVPTAPAPPGLMVPLLVSVLMLDPRSTVPLPASVPLFVRLPTRLKVVLAAVLIRPLWVNEPASCSVPASTWMVPVLLTSASISPTVFRIRRSKPLLFKTAVAEPSLSTTLKLARSLSRTSVPWLFRVLVWPLAPSNLRRWASSTVN